jgi:hypothetical protein
MGQTWKSLPQMQVIVTHSAIDYTIDALSVSVRRHENGFDTGTVVLEDTEARNYVDKVMADDTIEIKQRDATESWVTILDGIIRRVEPVRGINGNLLNVQCDGAGYGLNMTSCGQEYGTESSNASLDTIKEMIEDATNGIVPKWVNKVLGTATDSGYSYTTQIETIAGSIKYIYFPYKPNDKAINDIANVVQAIKGTNAGPHWIVDTSKHVLVATVGNHGAPASTYWPTWWRTNADGSTLVEGEDFVNFRFQHLAKEANYVLYHGRFKKPTDGDYWTENSSSLWGTSDGIADDNVNYQMGSYSIKGIASDAGAGVIIYYPSAMNASWDFTKIGGKHNIPTLNFWCMRDSEATAAEVHLAKYEGAVTKRYIYDLQSAMPSADKWYYFALPIGPYALPGVAEGFTGWRADGVLGGDWTDIDMIMFLSGVVVAAADFWVDNLNITGWVLRGARQSTAYSASDPLKLKLVTDEVGKDDTIVASDDSGLMGRLCYAEYLRQSTAPIVGTFTIPMANDLLPGQKIHLHAKKKSNGDFKIDKDFRVTRLIHTINAQGFLTNVDVTDDMTNANPRPIPTQINVLFGAVRPEFQDRQATSIKTREIDITQPILEKSY